MLTRIFQSARGPFKGAGLAMLGIMVAGLLAWAQAADTQDPFESLRKRLIADGFDGARIDALFASPAVAFEEKGVGAYFLHNEARLNYQQFSRKWNISAARNYMHAHQQALEKAQAKYGVDKEVITAIILVETNLGTYTGKKLVFNTLATLSALSEEGPRRIIWKSLPDNDRRPPRKAFDKMADQKSAWAYRELKAFLTYTGKEGMDPTVIKGSYAGAMGISQFMPSNISLHGKDGNDDGKIDLFDHADAISSIASYLKHYGWKPGMSRDEAFKVVYHYNHSKYYVNAILDVAKKLKG